MYTSPDTEEELEFQSAEKGGNDKDDDADEIDEKWFEEDEHNAAQYEENDAITRANIETRELPELNEDVMDMENPDRKSVV